MASSTFWRNKYFYSSAIHVLKTESVISKSLSSSIVNRDLYFSCAKPVCEMETRPIQIDNLSFHLNDLLGEGSFGAVYRGLFGIVEVAVKRVMKKEIEVDVDILLKAHRDSFHPNLLIYNCLKKDEHFL